MCLQHIVLPAAAFVLCHFFKSLSRYAEEMSDSKKSASGSAKDSQKSTPNGTPSKDASDEAGKIQNKSAALVDLGFLEEDDDFEEFPAESKCLEMLTPC